MVRGVCREAGVSVPDVEAGPRGQRGFVRRGFKYHNETQIIYEVFWSA